MIMFHVLSLYNFGEILVVESAKVVGITLRNTAYVISDFVSGLILKHTVRPDSFVETFNNAAANLQSFWQKKIWQINSIFFEMVPIKEGEDYQKVLLIIDKLSSNPMEVLQQEEKRLLNQVFKLATENEGYLSRFDFFISSKGKKTLSDSHRICKNLLQIQNPNFFGNFLDKIKLVSKTINNEQIVPLNEKDKLSVHDIAILGRAKALSTLATALQEIDIGNDLIEKWKSIDEVNTSKSFENLRELCFQSRSSGTIFLGNRNTVEVLTERNSSLFEILRNLYMGSVCHIGIFLNPGKSKIDLSHVNRFTNNHAVIPFNNPLILPFSYALELDISKLIPETVSEEDKKQLGKTFHKAFNKIASTAHSELPLAGDLQHLKVSLFGHKTPFSQKLSDVNFPSYDTPTLCSSYVGITFLMAIKEVNKELKKLGYNEQIAHPFGKHENLMNLDILRLIYLWKNLNIIKESPVNPIIANVMSCLRLGLDDSLIKSKEFKKLKYINKKGIVC